MQSSFFRTGSLFDGCLLNMSQRLFHACLSISVCMDFDFTIFTLYNIRCLFLFLKSHFAIFTFHDIPILRDPRIHILPYSHVYSMSIYNVSHHFEFEVIKFSCCLSLVSTLVFLKFWLPKYEFPFNRVWLKLLLVVC